MLPKTALVNILHYPLRTPSSLDDDTRLSIRDSDA